MIDFNYNSLSLPQSIECPPITGAPKEVMRKRIPLSIGTWLIICHRLDGIQIPGSRFFLINPFILIRGPVLLSFIHSYLYMSGGLVHVKHNQA